MKYFEFYLENTLKILNVSVSNLNFKKKSKNIFKLNFYFKY